MRYLLTFGFIASLSAQTLPKLVETYCSSCHNGRMRSPAGALLVQFDTAKIGENPAVWAKAYRHLQAGTMPPVGAPRPDRAAYDAALRSLEQELGANTKPPLASDAVEVAKRLASLLWNESPDEPLLKDAQGGKLDSAAVERHVRRMLTDPRAEAFASRFLFHWLELDKLDKADPDKKHFPDYEASLRDSFVKETDLFLLAQLREDRDPVELWSANYSFVNEQLAKHYGIANISGADFRRVTVPQERFGLLGQGSVLMATSRHQHGTDAGFTTPATRAKWVLSHFLGVPTPLIRFPARSR